MHRRDGPTRVPKLAIVVVLENPRTGSPRPGNELEATRGREVDAEGHLSSRCDIGEASAGSNAHSVRDHETFAIHRNRDDACTGRGKCAARAEVARVFEPGLISGVEHHATREIDPLLTSV